MKHSTMSRIMILCFAATPAAIPLLHAQPKAVTVVRAGRLINAENGRVLADRTIVVEARTGSVCNR